MTVDEAILWLYDFDLAKAYKAMYTFSKESLLKTITLKLETTSNNYSDMFTITALAFGNKPNKVKRQAKKLPKASFDTMAGFIGAM